jgi:glycosyltransferase involved in cell wall biosynthesis
MAELPVDPTVSVIVPVRDAGDDLRRLVDALAAQSLERAGFEVIVVDDGSTDGSAVRVGTRDRWIRVLSCRPENPYAARNRGAAVARGSVLAFCDADCRPEADWLARGVAALEGVDLVAGSVLFTSPERKTVWALVDTETFLDQERAVRAGRAVTANLFVRRTLFEREGGFDGTIANGGDHEFVSRCVASGARLTYAPDVVVWHPTRAAARAFLGKVWTVNRRHGIRLSRRGERPSGAGFRGWIPAVQTLRNRVGAGRPLALERRRLDASGIHVTTWDRARALPVIYLVVPYVGAAGQLVGWWQGRRLRSTSSAGTVADVVAPPEIE